MKSIRLSVPATSANVGPGYDIFALALEEPRDEFLLELIPGKEIEIRVEPEDTSIPLNPPDNTAGLALIELRNALNLETGFRFTIFKKMRSGGGMGTTGASAAAAIYGANRLLNLGLQDNQMVDFARKGEVASGGSPHADNVAAALMGGFVLIKSYSPMDVLKLNLPDMPVVLAAIRKSQRTTRGFITYEIGQEKLKEQMARCSRVIHAIHDGDPVEFGKAISRDYIHEPVRGAAIPGYWEVKEKVMELGAWGCTISGGGSSVIAFCPEEKQMQIARFMEDAFRDNPLFVKVYQTRTSNSGVEIVEP
ncbi:MAG: homoserine kinase [Bacteroidales bacterium]